MRCFHTAGALYTSRCIHWNGARPLFAGRLSIESILLNALWILKQHSCNSDRQSERELCLVCWYWDLHLVRIVTSATSSSRRSKRSKWSGISSITSDQWKSSTISVRNLPSVYHLEIQVASRFISWTSLFCLWFSSDLNSDFHSKFQSTLCFDLCSNLPSQISSPSSANRFYRVEL